MGAPAGGLLDGAVFVVMGPATGSITVPADGIALSNETALTDFGAALATGDGNADGVDDLVVAAPSVDSTYLFLGPVTADRTTVEADAVLEGVARDDAGTSVEIVFDVDADGVPDIVVGAPRAGAGERGAVYVVSGAVSGTVDLTTDATYVYSGGSGSDLVGYSGVDIGDADGDGIGDLAISAIGASVGGAVYVVQGGALPGAYDAEVAAAAALHGDSASAVPGLFGYAVASADYDSDGAVDLFVGAPATSDAMGVEAGSGFRLPRPVRRND